MKVTLTNEKALALSTQDMANMIVALAEQSGKSAGTALEDFASARGDELAREVLRQTDPLVLAKILGEHDYTIPSIASWLITPEILRDVIEIQPIHWETSIREDPDAASQYALEFFTYIFGREDDADQLAELMEIISHSDSGIMYLHLALYGLEIMHTADAEARSETEDTEDGLYGYDPGADQAYAEAPEPGSREYLYHLINGQHPTLAKILADAIKSRKSIFGLADEVFANAQNKLEQRVTGLQPGESLDDFFAPLD
ncbi:hypothetical protein [Candidatus Thiodictyon syntrophicum]|jgi:hypothetical protein|nr:hypothetical protein [Candidatus Thiodictyon syntrophicum]